MRESMCFNKNTAIDMEPLFNMRLEPIDIMGSLGTNAPKLLGMLANGCSRSLITFENYLLSDLIIIVRRIFPYL